MPGEEKQASLGGTYQLEHQKANTQEGCEAMVCPPAQQLIGSIRNVVLL